MTPLPKNWLERLYDLAYYYAGQNDTTIQDELQRLAVELANAIGTEAREVKDWISDERDEVPEPFRKQVDQALEEKEEALGLPQKLQLQEKVEAHFTGQHLPEGRVGFEGLADGRLVGAIASYEDAIVLLLAPPRTQIVGAAFVVQENPSREEAEEFAREVVNASSWPLWSKIGAQL